MRACRCAVLAFLSAAVAIPLQEHLRIQSASSPQSSAASSMFGQFGPPDVQPGPNATPSAGGHQSTAEQPAERHGQRTTEQGSDISAGSCPPDSACVPASLCSSADAITYEPDTNIYHPTSQYQPAFTQRFTCGQEAAGRVCCPAAAVQSSQTDPGTSNPFGFPSTLGTDAFQHRDQPDSVQPSSSPGQSLPLPPRPSARPVYLERSDSPGQSLPLPLRPSAGPVYPERSDSSGQSLPLPPRPSAGPVYPERSDSSGQSFSDVQYPPAVSQQPLSGGSSFFPLSGGSQSGFQGSVHVGAGVGSTGLPQSFAGPLPPAHSFAGTGQDSVPGPAQNGQGFGGISQGDGAGGVSQHQTRGGLRQNGGFGGPVQSSAPGGFSPNQGFSVPQSSGSSHVGQGQDGRLPNQFPSGLPHSQPGGLPPRPSSLPPSRRPPARPVAPLPGAGGRPRRLQQVVVRGQRHTVPEFSSLLRLEGGAEAFVTHGVSLVQLERRADPDFAPTGRHQMVLLNGQRYQTGEFVYVSDPSDVPILFTTAGVPTSYSTTGGEPGDLQPFTPLPELLMLAAEVLRSAGDTAVTSGSPVAEVPVPLPRPSPHVQPPRLPPSAAVPGASQLAGGGVFFDTDRDGPGGDAFGRPDHGFGVAPGLGGHPAHPGLGAAHHEEYHPPPPAYGPPPYRHHGHQQGRHPPVHHRPPPPYGLWQPHPARRYPPPHGVAIRPQFQRPYPPRLNPLLPLLPTTCGTRGHLSDIYESVFGEFSGRISSGYGLEPGVADYATFPWHAAVLRRTSRHSERGRRLGGLEYVCGATLVSSDMLVTAAHCVQGDQEEGLVVRLGEYNLYSDQEELYGPYDAAVRVIHVHPEYLSSVFRADLAVLQLAAPVPLQQLPHVTPACLPGPDLSDDSTVCQAPGWGYDAYKTQLEDAPHALKAVTVQPIGPEACEAGLRESVLGKEFRLQRDSFCAAGSHGQDTCLGDGGGGLVCPVYGSPTERSPARYQLVGVTSWGVHCGDGKPGVYANVHHHIRWLDSVINSSPFRHSPPVVID
ncbi:trithorax group protein osa-like [Pollicipes pollicipes]|uniref:trithorax group protein osa-like n=1 Tax=Pollicipes pollicipes TaxID=41117 RepID=UPI00188576FC|nr:trithorax group protein osa-like [Pollicipes pollicipes]XP_037069548.1 trithorax group protein osa-like [Pollicipes pollicipes]XP_037069549.1 trithorax group protein osa-like [Pollicipes pollicipes]XP_037069550.1 trithorax group protein osa-like [Pollicipes pollicipes]XP_037069551.1 trithorax group protein osa-like [Pollicipes pollicipes]